MGFKKVYKTLSGQVLFDTGNFTGIVEDEYASKYWYANSLLHREDGPAYENRDGYKEWWLNGQHHREDGPAREWPNGLKLWESNGEQVFINEKFLRLNNLYVVLERGIPTTKMFGKLKLTQAKLLTVDGIEYFPDNLPGWQIGEGNE